MTNPEVPTKWRNLLADFPEFQAGYNGVLPEASRESHLNYLPKMPLSMGRQSRNVTDRYIQIPDEVLALYRLYRPTPLKRARNFERSLNTGAKIYVKFEGQNISGSHKLNSAIAQAYYYKNAGVEHLVTGTGAGQWGSAIAYACSHFGLKCTIFMPRVSLQQKPQRKTMMELFGATVYESPSNVTQLGRRINSESPDKLGSLAIATGEALEMVTSGNKRQFAVGSGENHVLLHQTIIGEEAKWQLEQLGEWPDSIYACMGAGSNFAGISFPFLCDENGRPMPDCVAAEPMACPKITRGMYAYTATDFSGTTPIARMMTLGTDYEAPGIHAGGLRYHGTSPFLSSLYQLGIFRGVALPQRQVFATAINFARCEGILPAPESAHALAAAAQEFANKPEEKTCLINISGMGYHDLAGYAEYAAGTMDDGILKDAEIDRSLAALQAAQARFESAVNEPEMAAESR
jgi:tryptophan synthase beta chain